MDLADVTSYCTPNEDNSPRNMHNGTVLLFSVAKNLMDAISIKSVGSLDLEPALDVKSHISTIHEFLRLTAAKFLRDGKVSASSISAIDLSPTIR